MEQIASGLYGKVFTDAALPGVVVKTGDGTDAWWAYARWAMAVRAGLKPKIAAHIVDVRAMGTLPNGDQTAIMVKYKKTVGQADRDDNNGAPRATQILAENYLRKLVYAPDGALGIRAPNALPTSLAMAVLLIARWARCFAPESGCDLHSGNMMIASDGSLVITDPFSAVPGETSSEQRRRTAYLGTLRACSNPK